MSRSKTTASAAGPAFFAALAVFACGAADGAGGDAGGETASDVSQDSGMVAEGTPAPQGDLVPIRVAGIEVMVEIADDNEERSRGLMHRESLPEDQGMLFVYTDERTLSFWMRNTLIPLDIAYIDREGRIVDIQQMEPQDSTTHPSAAPAMYALEMNQGWFEAHDVEVGDRIEF